MNKELTDVSSYVKTVNYVDLSTVLGEGGCNDKAFIKYLNNEGYAFGTSDLTLVAKLQVGKTLRCYAGDLLTCESWIHQVLARLSNLPKGTFINLKD